MANRTYHQREKPVHGYPVQEHPLYRTWSAMMSRCYSEACPSYKNYGARGITVTRAWHHFENFAVDMWPKPEGEFSIERKDNNKGYSKTNCTWATRSEQCLNRRKFSNNTTGHTGVVAITAVDGGRVRYEARLDYEHVRYKVGRFDSAHDAAAARATFVDLFFTDMDAAVAMVESETIWCTSTTGVRGVTPHKDGGYIVRATVGGVRHYLGYFKTFDEACDARTAFIKK